MPSALRSGSLRWLSSLLTLAVLACGGDSEVPAPPAVETAAKTPPGAVWTFDPPDATVELPSQFPADVPRYPDARIARAEAGHDGFGATFVTSEDVDDATEDYAEMLEDEGWTTRLQHSEKEQMIFATKDKRSVVATVQETKAGTAIMLVVGEPD